MEKIICDVCGTAYPETSAQCPICGCARPACAERSDKVAPSPAASAGTYEYVRGGRFSKANVRRRAQAEQQPHAERAGSAPRKPQKNKSDDKINILAILLLAVIVTVAIFICIRFFAPDTQPQGVQKPATNNSEPSDLPAPSGNEPANVACVDISMNAMVVEMGKAGQTQLLNVTIVPANCTQTVTYVSSDPAVATVTPDGCVTAVAPGQAFITVACGNVSKECRVVCQFQTQTPTQPDPTQPDPTQPDPTQKPTDPPQGELSFNREDFTLFSAGESWEVYDGTVSKLLIEWTSDDPDVATIDGGVVTAVGSGMTEVHAEYNGKKVSCIVRCDF